MSNELIFLICVIALVFIAAYTAFGRRGQSNISEHPVDTRSDVPAGAEPHTGMSDRPDPTEADNPNAQRGVR